MKKRVTLSDGSTKIVDIKDIEVGRLFSTPEGGKVLNEWIQDNMKNNPSTDHEVWKEQGVREFINSLRLSVSLISNLIEVK